jgi:hypothetical protein
MNFEGIMDFEKRLYEEVDANILVYAYASELE